QQTANTAHNLDDKEVHLLANHQQAVPEIMVIFQLRIRQQQSSTLFPYTTLFRSRRLRRRARRELPPGDDGALGARLGRPPALHRDRKSTRLNSSHDQNSYAVFCLKKKTS